MTRDALWKRRRKLGVGKLCAVAAMTAILLSCGPVPFNVNVSLFVPESYLAGTMPLPGESQEIPAETTNLGAMTWQVPLHDLRVAIDLSSGLPATALSEATMTVTLETALDPPDTSVTVDADATVTIYLAAASTDDLWQAEWSSGAGEIRLAFSEPITLEAPLTPTQVEALSAGRIKLGLEIAAPEVRVTGTASGFAQLDGFLYEIHEIRLVGTAEASLGQLGGQ